jgi:hypothetical protein
MADQARLFKLSAVLLGALILGGIMNTKPRGIRNNNAGNIRGSDLFTWKGEIGRDDKDFVIFDTPENGLRALARTLRTYRNNHGINTIEGIIHRYAPPSENITSSYAEHAASALGLPLDATLSESDYPDLMRVIIKHENGMQPYTDAQIMEGFQRGFIG